MEKDTPLPDSVAFLCLWCIKRHLAFSFKLNLVLKTVAAFFSEINHAWGSKLWSNGQTSIKYCDLACNVEPLLKICYD